MSRFGFSRRVEYMPDPGPGPGSYKPPIEVGNGDRKAYLEAECQDIMRRRGLASKTSKIEVPSKPDRYANLIATLNQINTNRRNTRTSSEHTRGTSGAPYLARASSSLVRNGYRSGSDATSGHGGNVNGLAGSNSSSTTGNSSSSTTLASQHGSGPTNGSSATTTTASTAMSTGMNSQFSSNQNPELRLNSRGPTRPSRLIYSKTPAPPQREIEALIDPPSYRAAWLRLRPNESPGPVLLKNRNSTASSQTFSSPPPAHTAEQAAAQANSSRPSSSQSARGSPTLLSATGQGIPPGAGFTHGDRNAPVFISEDHSRHMNQGLHGPGPKYKLPDVDMIARARPPSAPLVPGSGRSHSPSIGSAAHAPSFGLHPHSRFGQRVASDRRKMFDNAIGPGSYSVDARLPKWGDVSVTSGAPRVHIGGDSPRFFESGTGPYISRKHEKTNVGGQSPGPKYFPKYFTLESELIRKKGPPPIPVLPSPDLDGFQPRPSTAPASPHAASQRGSPRPMSSPGSARGFGTTTAVGASPAPPSPSGARPSTPPAYRPSTPSPRLGPGPGDFSPRTPKPLDRSQWLHSQNVRARAFGKGSASWAISPSDPLCASPAKLSTVMRTDVKRGEVVESCTPGPGKYNAPSDFKPSNRHKRQVLMGQVARQKTLREQQLKQQRQQRLILQHQQQQQQRYYQQQMQDMPY